MIKKIVLPIIFALVGTSFVTYSFLDTFVIVKNAKKITFSSEYEYSFTPYIPAPTSSAISSSSAPKPTSSSKDNSSSSSSISSTSKPASSSSSEAPISSSSSAAPSSSANNQTVEHQYYEDLTLEQFTALFTPTKEFTERKHYSDPDIYIDITTHRDEADTTTYYAADIRIKNLAYFKTALAKDKFGQNIKERTSDICKRKKGILGINGDTYGSQEGGYVIRNGNLEPGQFRFEKNLSRKKPEDLIVKKDGTFEIIDETNTSFEQVLEQNPLHVFSFGPGLVNKNEVTVTPKDEVGVALSGNRNQRCAIGIVSPGHYYFVVSDGRNSDSSGISLYTLANIMKDLHCETAYNLDGGGSATMWLDNGTGNADGLAHLINVPGQLQGDSSVKQREVSDIVYIGKEQ